MKAIILSLTIAACVSCASFEIHVKKQELRTRPAKILIGQFEKRTVKYNPFIAKNFRDELRFELFKLGYKSELVETEDSAPPRKMPDQPQSQGQNKSSVPGKLAVPPEEPSIVKREAPLYFSEDMIKATCAKHQAELFIQGSLSETDIGDITDLKTSALITFLIYGSSGQLIGEARYMTSDTLNDAGTVKNATRQFTARLNSMLK